jgi:flavin reductase (DIM6/NTAB) family NADH-FMN oxidoreductase RutF
MSGLHGLPYLEGAAASFFCFIEQQIDYGTHTIFVGRVQEVMIDRAAQPLIFRSRQMGCFAPFQTTAP